MYLSIGTSVVSTNYYFLCSEFILPFAQGIFGTEHFLLSVSGVQDCVSTSAEEESGLGVCGTGTRTRDWEPFLNPHVLFFFIQEDHWLHSPNSHSEAR